MLNPFSPSCRPLEALLSGEELLSVLAATGVMLFELLLGDGQDLFGELTKLPDLVEVLEDGRDHLSRLGVVGAHQPQHPHRVRCTGVGAQFFQGFEDVLLAVGPLGQYMSRHGLVAPDEGQPPAGGDGQGR